MQSDLFSYIEQLQARPTLDAAWDAICEYAAERGFKRVGCCYGAIRNGKPIDNILLRGNYSGAVGKRWSTSALYKHDPVVARALASPVPFCWGLDYLPDDVHADVRDYYVDLAKDGARTAFMVPLRCDPMRGFGIGSVGSELPGPLFEAGIREVANEMTMAILFTDMRMTALARAVRKGDAKLSPREAQCLELLTAGHKNEAIAGAMGITVHTVQLHLAAAKRKLGAATREQAIAKAINFRLIRS